MESSQHKTVVTAVAGFRNTGARLDDKLNLLISKSLINFLSRIDGYSAVPFDSIQDFLLETQNAGSDKPGETPVKEFFQRFKPDSVITGEYLYNSQENTITIIVRIYSETAVKPLFEQRYTSSMGVAFFDVLDQMIEDVSSTMTGRLVTTARLNFSVLNTNRSYNFYINGSFQKVISSESPFSDIVPANEPLLISIYKKDSEQTLYTKTLLLKTDESANERYEATGVILLRMPDFAGSRIFIDSAMAGTPNFEGALFISNLPAGEHTEVIAVDGEKTNVTTLIEIQENQTNFLNLYPSLYFRFPLELLNGGSGATAGVEFYPMHFLRLSAQAGAVSIASNIIPTADFGVFYKLAEYSFMRLWLGTGFFFYFTDPLLYSPGIKLELCLGMFFLQGGTRYSLDDNTLYPMGCLGVRF